MSIPKTWIRPLGSISNKAQKHFDILEQGFVAALKEFDGKISYKEMYQVASLAAAGAVARLVVTHVSKRDASKARYRRNRHGKTLAR